MKLRPFFFAFAFVFVAASNVGCESRVSLGARCDSTTLCPSPLVCGVGGRCRVECLTSAQCPMGERCLVDVSVGVLACSIERETCTSDCAAGLECVAGECQSRCMDNTDCPDGECLPTGVCRAIVSGTDGGLSDASSIDAGPTDGGPIGTDAFDPTTCQEGPAILDVDVGLESTCALAVDGSAYCWGYYGVVGPRAGGGPCQIGGRPGCYTRPVRIAGIPTLSQLTVGGNIACGISSETATLGEVWCWGEIDFAPAAPRAITLPDGATRIHASYVDAGRVFACAITTDATPRVLCWGDQDHGVLGNGVSVMDRPLNDAVVAVQVGTPDPGGLTLSAYATLVREGQSVRGVGLNDDSEIADPDSVSEVTGVVRDLGTSVVGLAATADNVCVLLGTTPHCWGRHGNLSHPAIEPPMCISGAACTNEATIFAEEPLAAITGDPYGDAVIGWNAAGQAFGWGSSSGNILSMPNVEMITALTALGGDTISDAAIGAHTACAIVRAGSELRCWGLNENGQLGIGAVDGDSHTVAAPPCW